MKPKFLLRMSPRCFCLSKMLQIWKLISEMGLHFYPANVNLVTAGLIINSKYIGIIGTSVEHKEAETFTHQLSQL